MRAFRFEDSVPSGQWQLFYALDKKPVVTISCQITEVFVPDFLTPAGHIVLGIGITGPNLQNFTDPYTAYAFLGFQQWTRASHRPGVNNFRCFDYS
jgi:hypothetical protein